MNDYDENQQADLTEIAKELMAILENRLKLKGYTQMAIPDVLHSMLAGSCSALCLGLVDLPRECQERLNNNLSNALLEALREFTYDYCTNYINETTGGMN